MEKKYKTNQIKSLIRKGYKLRVISFQLGIPIEKLEELKEDIEREQQNKDYQKKLLEIYATKKKFDRLLTKKNEDISQVSEAEIELMYARIDEIERRIKSTREDRETNNKLMTEFAQAIDTAVLHTEDIEQLRRLQRKITQEMLHQYQIIINSTERKITTKIEQIQRNNLTARINNVPQNILEIAKSLLDGTIDIQEANVIIDAEAKKRAGSRSENKFALSFEQEKRQTLIQIQKAVEERINDLPIDNPEIMISQVQELLGLNLQSATRTVVTALINRKDYETANNICDTIIRRDRKSEVATRIRALKQDIRNAEIGDVVLKLINMDMTAEEKVTYFERIENGINAGNIKPRMIPLGTSVDGTRKITLADIWKSEKVK